MGSVFLIVNKTEYKYIYMSTITFKLQEIPRSEEDELRGYYPVLAHPSKISASQLCQMIQERSVVKLSMLI